MRILGPFGMVRYTTSKVTVKCSFCETTLSRESVVGCFVDFAGSPAGRNIGMWKAPKRKGWDNRIFLCATLVVIYALELDLPSASGPTRK